MPMPGMLPVRADDNRIKTDSNQIYILALRQRNLLRDFPDPDTATAAGMAGFRQQDWTLIALVHFAQKTMQRTAARIIQMPVQRLVGLDLPLIVVVIVHTDQIEIAWGAAQLRLQSAAQHIPCFILGVP